MTDKEKQESEYIPEPPAWAEEDQTPENHHIAGFSTIPCNKETIMNGIGGSLVIGLGYNLLTSRPPFIIAAITAPVIGLATWIPCRRTYFKSKLNIS